MQLAAGNLDQRITIQVRDAGVDALGQGATTWSDVCTVWAQVQPLRGREYFAAGQLQAEVSVRMVIRHRTDITPAMRAVWRSRPHEIISTIDPDGQRVALELMCVDGVRDGRAEPGN